MVINIAAWCLVFIERFSCDGMLARSTWYGLEARERERLELWKWRPFLPGLIILVVVLACEIGQSWGGTFLHMLPFFCLKKVVVEFLCPFKPLIYWFILNRFITHNSLIIHAHITLRAQQCCLVYIVFSDPNIIIIMIIIAYD